MKVKKILRVGITLLLIVSMGSTIFAKKSKEKKKLKEAIAQSQGSPEAMLQLEQAAIKKALKNIYEPSALPLRPLENFLIPIGRNFEKLPFAAISEKMARMPAIALRPQFDIYIRGLQHRIEDLKRKLGKINGKDFSFLGEQRIQNFERKSDQIPASAPKKAMSILPNIVAKVLAKVIGDKPSDPIPELNVPLPFVSVVKSASYLDMFKIIRNLQQRMAILEARVKGKDPKNITVVTVSNSKNGDKLPIPELYEPLPWVPMATVFGAELAQAGVLATLVSGILTAPVTLGAAAAGAGIMAAAKKLSDHQRTIYLRSLQQELLKLEQLTAASLSTESAEEAEKSITTEEKLHKKPMLLGGIKPNFPRMRTHFEPPFGVNVPIDLLIEAAESAE